MCVQPVIGWPSYLLAAEEAVPNSSVQSVTAQTVNRTTVSPTPVVVNRTEPEVEIPAGFKLAENPLDEEVTECGALSEPLVPMTRASDGKDNAELAMALYRYMRRTAARDVSALVEFCAQNSKSRWRVAVLHNLGKLYYFQGYYSKALATWEEAWQEGKNATDGGAVALVNQTFAEVGRMNARLGRIARLEELVQESASRQFLGGSAEAIVNLKDALALMKHDPGHSFRCGPLALAEIRASQHLSDAGDQKIAAEESTNKGCSFMQVANLAAAAGMKYQLAKRDPGAAVITPAVVHWKVGHYAALVKADHGKYLAKDLTFQNNLWLSQAAIDEEASGYFLVPQGRLPEGWHPVTTTQIADIWGCGQTNNNTPGGESGDDPGAGCGGGGLGMAHYDVKLQAVSLTVFDTPVGYHPPVGPASLFTVRYHQRADGQPATFSFSNLGPNWYHDWMAYVVDDPTNPGADVALFPRGGGNFTFAGFSTTTQSYALDLVSNTTLVLISPTSYERLFPDGSKEVYAQPNAVTGAGRQVFLTQVVDSHGNTLTFKYDSKYRLVSVKDAIGQVTTLQYALKADPYKITEVKDPFGRSAKLSYASVNGTYMLASTTDEIGITSSFQYDVGFLHQLTTPYGKTTFFFDQNFGDIGTGRSVDIYDPENGHRRIEYNQNVNYSFSDSLIPSGMNLFNAYLNFRDTFYWDQHAMAVAPYDYTKAVVYHFQHSPDGQSTSRLLESVGRPLESRTWMNYPGQGQSGFENGVTIGKPSLVGRIVDNSGTTQLSQYSYNGLGNITSGVDPSGRITQFIYATNGIDVMQVQHSNGSSYDTVRSTVYNGQHLPTQITDAAGQITKITYNIFGEVVSVTNPKNEVTRYKYDSDGYLQTVTDALGAIQASYTYDGFGRVQTYTDVSGFTLTYKYDNLNRITETLYPDGTTNTYTYQNLSLIQSTDRLNRVTKYGYNSLQQLVEVTDPAGHKTQYSYCGCGSLNGITDGNGNTTTFIRDLEERLTQKIYADNSIVAVNYDVGGRLSSVVDAKNQTTSYKYWPDNLLQEVTYASPTPAVSFTYDAYGRVDSMTDGTGTTDYSYVTPGNLGALRLGTETKPTGYGTIFYNYDQLGRVVEELIYDAAGTLDARTFTYDPIGRISQEQNGLGKFTYQFVGSSVRLQTLLEPNNQTFNYQYYNAAGNFWLQKIQQVAGTATVSHQYTYDAKGNIRSWTQANPSDGTATWNATYDGDDELHTLTSQASKSGSGLDLGTGGWTDDPGANLTQFTSSSSLAAFQSALYQVNPLNQVTSITPGTSGATAISYDPNGNPLNGINAASANKTTVTGARTYTWDGANRLSQITYSGTGDATSLSYDGLGRLVRLVESVNGTIKSTQLYVWNGNAIVEQRNTRGTILKEYFNQGFLAGTTAYYYGKDHLGSIRNLTDATGTIQTQLDYGLYGELTGLTGKT